MVIVPELGCREVGCFSDVKAGFDEGRWSFGSCLNYLLFYFLNVVTRSW